MSEEIRVSIEPDQGIKNQWARGLFYRNDGKKRTFISNHFWGALLGGFSVMAIILVLQGTPNEPKTVQKTVWAAPVDVQSEKVENIPSILDTPRDSKVTQSPTNVSRTGTNRNPAKPVKFSGPQLVSRPRLGKIPPGSMIKATLLSGGSNGPVKAEVTEALVVNGETLIEEGTILSGTGQSGEDRLSIRFNQMIFKDGAFCKISSMGAR